MKKVLFLALFALVSEAFALADIQVQGKFTTYCASGCTVTPAATNNTSQTLMPVNLGRHYLGCKNLAKAADGTTSTSTIMCINFTGAASASTNCLLPGESFFFEGIAASTELVTIWASDTGHPFYCMEK